MLSGFKREKESKAKSRGYIEKTHDTVILTAERVENLKVENEKTNIRLDQHEHAEENMFKHICSKIEGHTCTQSIETAEIVEELSAAKKEQNGHLKDMEKHLQALQVQGNTSADTLSTILSIAEGRKSLWRELGLVIGAGIGIGGLVFAGLMYWK